MSNTHIDHEAINGIKDFSESAGAVLCIGDSVLDHHVHGTVNRVSPEAPIPVINKETETYSLGGAANVTANLASLHCQHFFISLKGNDQSGKLIEEKVKQLPFNQSNLVIDEIRPTPLKTRYIAQNQQLLRVDQENTEAIETSIQNKLLDIFKSHIKKVKIVIISDYGKGIFSMELTQTLIKIAHENNVRVIVDPKGKDYKKYKNADIITPNKSELSEATGMTTHSTESVIDACHKLIEEFNIGHIIATRGEKGMTMVSKSETQHIPTAAKSVYDVTGAGDTVVATIAACLANGYSFNKSIRIANIAAGIVVEKFGTATVGLDEINQKVKKQTSSEHIRHKIISIDEAQPIIEKWKEENLKIGFTNGCFDIIHPGHLSLLSQARANCHRLIVGLNSDDSVRLLKGNDRPFNNQTTRASILASLIDTDLIIIFSEKTPLNLIKTIKPNVLIKGADYKQDEVVGADFVKSYNGQIFLAQLEEGLSTTNIIKEIQDKKIA